MQVVFVFCLRLFIAAAFIMVNCFVCSSILSLPFSDSKTSIKANVCRNC